MANLKIGQRARLYEQVADRVADLIDNRTLKPGERIGDDNIVMRRIEGTTQPRHLHWLHSP